MDSQVFHSGEFKRYYANTLWLLVERCIRLVISVGVVLAMARYLGPHDYGQLSYALSYCFLFSIFVHLGLESIVVKELVDRKDVDEKIMLGTSFVLRLSGAIIAWLAIMCSVMMVDVAWDMKLMIMLIGSGLMFQSFGVIDFYFQSQVQAKYIAQAQFFQTILLSIVRVVFILTQQSVVWFAATFVLEHILLMCGLIWQYSCRKYSLFSWNFDYGYAKGLLKKSFPIMISVVAVMLYTRIDQIMIQHMLGSAQVGFYAIAVNMSDAVAIMAHLIIASLFPAIIQAKQHGMTFYDARLKQLFSLMLMMALVFTVIIYGVAPWLVPLLLGEKYLSTVFVVQVYSIGLLFIFWSKVNNKIMINEDNLWHDVGRKCVGLILNIVLNLYLIPLWGMVGAAVALIMSLAVTASLYYIVFPSTRRLFLLQCRSFLFLDTFHLVYDTWKNKLSVDQDSKDVS